MASFKFIVQNLKFLFVLVFNLSFSFSSAQKAIPELWGMRVHDDAHVLKQETVDQLEKELKVYQDSTSNQIAILIVQSLDGNMLEEYSLKVAEKWKLGQKGKDNGVLLFIAVDDHKMRIEVGQGLEGVLTDAQSNRIIRNEIAPEFRRGDYDTGVKAGVNGIAKAIRGEFNADDGVGLSSDDDIGIVGKIIGYGFLSIIYIMLISLTLASVFNTGCFSWMFYVILGALGALASMNLIGSIGGGVLFAIILLAKAFINRSRWGKRMAKSWEMKGGSGGGSSSSRGWFGGSSWSSGGSIFSGGGGSFGGGGSSGGW